MPGFIERPHQPTLALHHKARDRAIGRPLKGKGFGPGRKVQGRGNHATVYKNRHLLIGVGRSDARNAPFHTRAKRRARLGPRDQAPILRFHRGAIDGIAFGGLDPVQPAIPVAQMNLVQIRVFLRAQPKMCGQGRCRLLRSDKLCRVNICNMALMQMFTHCLCLPHALAVQGRIAMSIAHWKAFARPRRGRFSMPDQQQIRSPRRRLVHGLPVFCRHMPALSLNTDALP